MGIVCDLRGMRTDNCDIDDIGTLCSFFFSFSMQIFLDLGALLKNALMLRSRCYDLITWYQCECIVLFFVIFFVVDAMR